MSSFLAWKFSKKLLYIGEGGGKISTDFSSALLYIGPAFVVSGILVFSHFNINYRAQHKNTSFSTKCHGIHLRTNRKSKVFSFCCCAGWCRTQAFIYRLFNVFFLPFFAFFVFSKHKSFLVVALHCFSLSALTARWIVFSSESIFSCLSETVERDRERSREKRSNKQKMLSIGKFAFRTNEKYFWLLLVCEKISIMYTDEATRRWGTGWRENSPRETIPTRLAEFDPIFQNACRCDVFLVSFEGGELFVSYTSFGALGWIIVRERREKIFYVTHT